MRVYQDFAVLDLISHGRAEVIAGRSAFREPFDIFGESLEDYDALFREKLDLLLKLRDEDHVTWRPRFRPPLMDALIAPRARQNPLPVWVRVGGSAESAEHAGRLGLPMVLGFIGGPISYARQAVDIYRAAGERAGDAEQLIEKIVDAHRILRLDRFIGQVDWGGLPQSLVEESMTRFATEIAPAVRAETGLSAVRPA